MDGPALETTSTSPMSGQNPDAADRIVDGAIATGLRRRRGR
jgi:hypothetical protein